METDPVVNVSAVIAPGQGGAVCLNPLPERKEQAALHLCETDLVHAHEGVSLADDAPIALFRSVFPTTRFPELPDALRLSGSVTAALTASGIVDYVRTSTRLTSKQATATQGLNLRISEGAPILRSVGVDLDPEGRPVQYGRTWFAGDRVTLTLDADGSGQV